MPHAGEWADPQAPCPPRREPPGAFRASVLSPPGGLCPELARLGGVSRVTLDPAQSQAPCSCCVIACPRRPRDLSAGPGWRPASPGRSSRESSEPRSRLGAGVGPQAALPAQGTTPEAGGGRGRKGSAQPAAWGVNTDGGTGRAPQLRRDPRAELKET